MLAYVIVDAQITDHKTYDDYKRQVAPQIAKFGGRFLVRGGNHVVLEETLGRSTIVENAIEEFLGIRHAEGKARVHLADPSPPACPPRLEPRAVRQRHV